FDQNDYSIDIPLNELPELIHFDGQSYNSDVLPNRSIYLRLFSLDGYGLFKYDLVVENNQTKDLNDINDRRYHTQIFDGQITPENLEQALMSLTEAIAENFGNVLPDFNSLIEYRDDLNSYAIAQTVVITIGIAAAVVSLIAYAATWGTYAPFLIEAGLTLVYIGLSVAQLCVAWDDYYKVRDAIYEYDIIANTVDYKNVQNYISDLEYGEWTTLLDALSALVLVAFTIIEKLTPFFLDQKFVKVRELNKPKWVTPISTIAMIISFASAAVSIALDMLYSIALDMLYSIWLRNDYEKIRELKEELGNIWEQMLI
ncbi:MAG: hypothetical protein LBS95_02850, partial [Mycoplasmataceae bacterium]|nr:hypothetical protein [Mycoplasmataceae bacterium]